MRTTALFAAAFAGALSPAAASNSTFLVMGDWGGQPFWPYTTGAEVQTAKGMSAVATELSAPFALALGDNFYNSGVRNVDDSRFQNTFEKPFKFPSLSGRDFFRVIAGNHDHNGNVSAQVAYSGVSSRWHFPSEYYSFTEGLVDFVMIDTVILAGNSHGIDNDPDVDLAGDQLPGPLSEEVADAQMQWIEQQLQASKSPYLIVAGHYPVYSICEHGPTSNLIENLLPLLEKYKVSAYFNGHDHCAQHIDTGVGVQFHTIGSAHENDPSTAHASTVQQSQLKFHTGSGKGGFASVEVSNEGLVVTHRDGDGKVLYTAPSISPRS